MVNRRVNWVSQQRVDLNDLKSIESAASNDFDQLIQGFVTGRDQGYILRGFEISMAGAIGGAASGLQLLVDPGAVFHVTSSQSGTVLQVPSGTLPQQLNSATNSIVDGSFVPSAINYVGLEYERYTDDTTSAQIYLWSPGTDSETTKNAPRAIILRFRIKISTSGFASNVLPICTITTDSGNNVTTVTDARWNLFRLGQGGANPNPFYKYPWTAETEGRTESPSSSSSNSINPFRGGDKMLGTLKDWMDAVMTSIQEITGGTYWYSASSSGSLQLLREDLGNTLVTGNGTITHSKTAAGQINWESAPVGDGQIHLKVVGSRIDYKIQENPAPGALVTLAENQVAYIALTRGVLVGPNLNFVPNISLGVTVVTSIGNVAWTSALQAGDFIKAAADTDAFYYPIQSVDSTTQVTLTGVYTIANLTASGVQSHFAYGVYTLPGTTGTSRDIVIASREAVPITQDTVWLFYRTDDSGSLPRVYIKFSGAELSQGDSEDISGPQLHNVLQYIGSPIESATQPMYVSALNSGSAPQVTLATVGAASTITTSQYFLIGSSGNARHYYVWFKKDGAGADPAAPGTNASVMVPITTGQTAAQVAGALVTALGSTFDGDFVAVQGSGPNTNQVTITNTSAGATPAPSNFNVGAPFTIAVTTSGTGVGNNVIVDSENLTLAIKKLDRAIGAIFAALDSPSYDETIDIVVSGATPPTSLNGPIVSGTLITLPNNSRLGNVAQKYTVGKGVLEVFLNGQYLRVGIDYLEVGVSLSVSSQIQWNRENLVAGDLLEIRISTGGGGAGGGGGGVGPQGPPGAAGAPGLNGSQTPVSISTKTGSYTVLSSDCFLLGNCTSGAVTFTLPPASTVTGRMYYFKKVDSSANPMSVVGNGTETIDGSNSISTTTQYFSFSMISTGLGWAQF